MTEFELAEIYQPLFDKMSEHGLTLLVSEMDDIIQSAIKVQLNYDAKIKLLNSEPND